MAILNTIALSQLEDEIRFDPQYYTPNNMLFENEISGFPTIFLGAVAIITDGQHGYFKLDEQSEIRQITAKCIKEGLVDKSSADRLSSITHLKNLRSSLEKNDVLVTTAGTIGQIGLVTEEIPPANIDQDIGRIAIHNSEVSPFFVWAFLQSKFGRFQLERFTTGQVQTHLSLKKMKKLRIPLFSDHAEVEGIVGNFVASKKAAKDLYEQAQHLLESELGLDKLSFQKPPGYTSQFSELEQSRRMDADYFQVPFRQIQNHLKKLETVSLYQLTEIVKGIEVGSQAYTQSGIPFLRVSNVKERGIALGASDKYISEKLYRNLISYQPQVGELLLTKDGTPGICYAIDQEIDGIISGGIVRLIFRDTEIPEEYLALVINSKACRMQIEQDCSGALIVHWKPSSIRKLRIPIISTESMLKIDALVTASKQATQDSAHLLNQAKTRVEQLIEEAVRS